ncbi:hypothetical protein FB45DRAFT_551342 [Roridomyces roridus]|uniref:Mid2 domain-containing protein n=1 Tax=Roridomyces roridus TaxID=1738132 RepID=A0AAD7FLM1_9AGAR|nr:hypothetical protein FB45DRAFT_551342 [Roridomyces roridus]
MTSSAPDPSSSAPPSSSPSSPSSSPNSTPSSPPSSTPSSPPSSTPPSSLPGSTSSSIPSSTPSSIPSSTPSSPSPSSIPPSSSSPIAPSSSVPSTPSASFSAPSLPPTPSGPTSSAAISSPTPGSTVASIETLQSIVVVTTTDSAGQTVTSTPSAVTTVVTFTSNGMTVTTTEVKINPTLGSDGSGSGSSSFFRNTGAVAGVFVIVGLAAASILLWALFGIRRRRKNRRIQHDDAVTATLAAGFHRAPLGDDEDRGGYVTPDVEMRSGSALALGTHTASSLPSGGRLSGYQDDPGDGFNPYPENEIGGPTEGYVPARTSSPPPSAFVEPYRDAPGIGPEHGHYASASAGSMEPLLTGFNRRESPAPSGANLDPPTPPPRNPQRVLDQPSNPRQKRRQSTASSVYSNDSPGDDRLNPALRNSEIQDSEDYSRPVLGVRNIPDDGASQVSG